MSWFKGDDKYHSNPKTLKTSFAARGLWVTSLSWAAANLTDGFVSVEYVRTLGDHKTIGRLAKELVKLGWWTPVWEDSRPNGQETAGDPPPNGGQTAGEMDHDASKIIGWMIHDYLDYNPSKQAVMARREASKRRVMRHRSTSKAAVEQS